MAGPWILVGAVRASLAIFLGEIPSIEFERANYRRNEYHAMVA